MPVLSGLDQLQKETSFQSLCKGNIGLLCHAASINSHYQSAPDIGIELFGKRFTKIFGPQHGFVGDVQDNMIETDHFTHPHFKRPVYSLYSETREPTDEMLKDIDTVVIDLQDIGTRIYTYIYTMGLFMRACQEKDIKVVVLDRPNPIGGEQIEGNLLDLNFKSFVGLYELPVRHSLTLGEMAKWIQKFQKIDCQLDVIPLKGWQRNMYFQDTGLPWVLPSPNIATPEAALTFPATVLFEGTKLSEGRGSTRSLEIIGHPKLNPHEFLENFYHELAALGHLETFVLRPLYFRPTFQKHQGKTCGGLQIHPLIKEKFRPWKLGQVLLKFLYQSLGKDFAWSEPPYEYQYHGYPIDFINGGDQLRKWVEDDGPIIQLDDWEKQALNNFEQQKSDILLYP